MLEWRSGGLTINHVNNHRGGVATAGRAGVVTGVLVSRLGHYESTLGALVVIIIAVPVVISNWSIT